MNTIKLLVITQPETHPEFDTTVELYRRLASHPKIDLFHISPENLIASFKTNTTLIKVAKVSLPLSYKQFLDLNNQLCDNLEITDFDLIFDRTDKPFPEEHLSTLARIEKLICTRSGKTIQFVNSPSAILNLYGRNGVDSITHKFMPDNIITSSAKEATDFLAKHKSIVAKKNISYGGKGIYKISQQDGKFYLEDSKNDSKEFRSVTDLFNKLFESDSDPFQLVRFLRNIGEGDKRVLVVDGQIYGAYIRKSGTGHWVHNITAGGKGILAQISDREIDTVNSTVQNFSAQGIYTLGYDFLMDDDGDWILSEINFGNIGGYNRLEELSGKPIFAQLITWLINGVHEQKFVH